MDAVAREHVATNEADLDELLRKSGRGDARAFRQLYDAVAPRLMAVAFRMLNDRQQAEDVVQETLIAAWRSGAEYDSRRSQAATWLISITRYRALDLIRKHGRQRDILHDGQQDIRRVLGHDDPEQEGESLPPEVSDRLQYCFGEISRDQAGCIQLAYTEGLTLQEIALRLERPIGTIKSWMRRGLQKLRECVEL